MENYDGSSLDYRICFETIHYRYLSRLETELDKTNVLCTAMVAKTDLLLGSSTVSSRLGFTVTL